MKITTNYHPLNHKGDVLQESVYGSLELEDFICSNISSLNELVYVLAYESKHFDTIFVEHETTLIDLIASSTITEMCDFDMDENVDVHFYLFEFDSYEEAYKLCLDLREPTGLAYEDKGLNAIHELLNANLPSNN